MTHNRFTIEVMATDGTVVRRVLWIRRQPNGVYWALYLKGIDFHMSYHRDGSRWQTLPGADKAQRIGQGPPLDDFAGFVQLSSSAFAADVNSVQGVPYRGKYTDEVLFIDTRRFRDSSKHIGLNIVLVEPGNPGSIHPFLISEGEFRPTTVHMVCDVSPWILLWVYRVGSR